MWSFSKGLQYIYRDVCGFLLPRPGAAGSGIIAGQIPPILPQVSSMHLNTSPSFLQDSKIKFSS